MDKKQLYSFFESLEQNACEDNPSKRDIKFDEVFWAIELPKRVIWDNTQAQNQNLKNTPSTKYGCVFYTAAHIINEENYLESVDMYQELQWSALVKVAVERKLMDENSWAFLQSGPKLSVDLWYSSGYTTPQTLEQVKQAIAMRQLVQFGSRSIDWKKTLLDDNDIIHIGTCYGHSMTFEWYDDNLHGWVLVVRNSMGEFAPFRGRQFLRYSDFDTLFIGKYAYVDKTNEEFIKAAQKKNRLQLAHEKWYWNLQRPNDFATRYEASRIAIRMSKHYWTNIPEDKLWNKKDKNANVIVQDAKAMFERASGKKFSFDLWNWMSKITRSDLAALSVRI